MHEEEESLLTELRQATLLKIKILGRMLKAYPLFLIGTVVISSFVAVALLAPLLAPPTSGDPYICPYDGPPHGTAFFVPPPPTYPSSEHVFGTLAGFDLYYACIWGTRIALYLTTLTTVISLAVGLTIGSIAGYFEGLIDEVLMRMTDAFFALPGILFVLLIVMALPSQWTPVLDPLSLGPNIARLNKIILALAIVGWPSYARLVRGEMKKTKQLDFVEAAKASGCSRLRVLFRHVLPNSINPVLSLVFLNMGGVLVAASTVSFLGYGPSLGFAEWGSIIAGTRNYLVFATPESAYIVLLLLIPGAFLLAFVLGWSLLGDSLMYIIDPVLGRRLNIWGSQDSSSKD